MAGVLCGTVLMEHSDLNRTIMVRYRERRKEVGCTEDDKLGREEESSKEVIAEYIPLLR